MTGPTWDTVQVGDVLPALAVRLRRVDLVRYAGASGDFNVIHWNERVARAVGLPDVIAHGMLTMAEAARVITDWTGDPGSVLGYGTRFSAMVVVPDDDEGTAVELGGTVVDKLDGRRVVVELTASTGAAKALSKARATVRLA